MLVKLDHYIISPSRDENKTYLSCHHPVGICSITLPETNSEKKHLNKCLVGKKAVSFWNNSLFSGAMLVSGGGTV